MMNMKFERRNRISCTLLRIVGKLSRLHKRARCYGTDEQLFDAEIHMIKLIKENEGIHVTGLADLLGVTKGAVSQIIMKLEKKGMIVKDVDPSNLSRLVLSLTPKGETAYEYHEQLHQELDNLVGSVLDGATEGDLAFLTSFLTSLEGRIDTLEREKRM